MARDTVKDFANMGRRDARKALDAMGGPDTIRSKIVQTPNGPVRVRTHGGLPRSYPLGGPPEVPVPVPSEPTQFLTLPVSEDHPNGYAPADMSSAHHWLKWNSAQMPPNAVVDSATNALQPGELVEESSIPALVGRHTWYSPAFVTLKPRPCVVSWDGPPWRYGTYGNGYYGGAGISDLGGLAAGTTSLSIPFKRMSRTTGAQSPGSSVVESEMAGAITPFSNTVWIDHRQITTDVDVLSAALRVVDGVTYIYYVGTSAAEDVSATYSVRRFPVSATIGTPTKVIGEKLGAETEVCTIALPVAPDHPDSWSKMNTRFAQMPFFNASGSNLASLITYNYSSGTTQQQIVASCTVVVDTGVCSEVLRSVKITGSSGSGGSDLSDVETGPVPLGYNATKTRVLRYSYQSPGNYNLFKTPLLCDWVGDALEHIWCETHALTGGVLQTESADQEVARTETVTVSGNLSTRVRTFDVSVDFSYSASRTSTSSPFGESGYFAIKSNNRGTLVYEDLNNGASGYSDLISASGSASATHTVVTNLDTGTVVSDTWAGDTSGVPVAVSGSFSFQGKYFIAESSRGWCADGDVRVGAMVFGALLNAYTDGRTGTYSGSFNIDALSDFVGQYSYSRTSNITSDIYADGIYIGEWVVSLWDLSASRVTPYEEVYWDDSYSQTTGAFLPTQFYTPISPTSPSESSVTTFGVPRPQFFSNEIYTASLTPKLNTANVCGVASCIIGETQYAYTNLETVCAPGLTPLRRIGFWKKVGSASAEFFDSSGKDYSPAADRRSLARSTFLPVKFKP